MRSDTNSSAPQFAERRRRCYNQIAVATTFTFNGIEFTVPTSELADALRQLQSLDQFPSKMDPESKRSSTSPAQLSLEPDVSNDAPLPKSTMWRIVRTRPASTAAQALKFLKVINDHRVSGGAPVDVIQRVLGVQHPKGVGSATARVNAVLEAKGFAVENVYTNHRDTLGMRYWKSGPAMDEAIEQLSAEVADQSTP